MTTPTEQQAASNARVSVACKLPHGLVIEVGKRGDDKYKRVQLNGANHKSAIAGFGLTEVSKEIWDEWCKRTGKKLVPVKKGLVFARDIVEQAQAEAADRHGLKTGLEALDPKDKKKHGIKPFSTSDNGKED